MILGHRLCRHVPKKKDKKTQYSEQFSETSDVHEDLC